MVHLYRITRPRQRCSKTPILPLHTVIVLDTLSSVYGNHPSLFGVQEGTSDSVESTSAPIPLRIIACNTWYRVASTRQLAL